MNFKQQPIYADNLFVLGVLLLWLKINFDFNLSSIYDSMAMWSLIGYLIPIIFGFFIWPNIMSRNNRMLEIIVGIVASVVFIYFYKQLTTASSMSSVFAATAFGGSEFINKLIFSLLIPTLETVFFFIIIPAWVVWKFMGTELMRMELLSWQGALTMVFGAATFTLFHATAKGLTNNTDLMATFIFGVLSVGLIIYFKTAISALIAHSIVNGYSTGALDFILKGNMLMIAGGVVLAIYLIKENRFKVPFLN